MAAFSEPRRDHPCTYFVQDRSSQQELARLQIQDQLLTRSMGGVLPEQPDLSCFERVLDVGCGTGGWLIELAKTIPSMRRLVGVDVNTRMLAFAREQAEAQGVADRVSFQAMDALRMLEFPTDAFDLVNQRLGMSYLRKWDWPKLLREFRRVTRPGGVLRLTEGEVAASNSPAFSQICELLLQAFYQAGHFFTPAREGVTGELPRLLGHAIVERVETRTYRLLYRSGTPEGDAFVEDMAYGMRTSAPFVHKWGRLPDDDEALCQQAMREMRHPDFVATLGLCTVWGTVVEEHGVWRKRSSNGAPWGMSHY